jgi:hypothetical protein
MQVVSIVELTLAVENRRFTEFFLFPLVLIEVLCVFVELWDIFALELANQIFSIKLSKHVLDVLESHSAHLRHEIMELLQKQLVHNYIISVNLTQPICHSGRISASCWAVCCSIRSAPRAQTPLQLTSLPTLLNLQEQDQ